MEIWEQIKQEEISSYINRALCLSQHRQQNPDTKPIFWGSVLHTHLFTIRLAPLTVIKAKKKFIGFFDGVTIVNQNQDFAQLGDKHKKNTQKYELMY